MASVEKRGGVYLVRWRHLGSSRSKTFKTHEAAQAYRRQVEADQATGAPVDPRASKATLAAWHREWTAGRLHLRPSTAAKNRHIANHFLAAFGRAQLGQITTADVQTFVAGLRLAPSSVAEVYGELKKCLDSAVVNRKLRLNPCTGINLPRAEREEMTILGREQVAHLANAIDPHYKSFVLFLAYSGLRVGEAAALTPADVDIARGVVRINKTTSEVDGVWSIQPPKTRAGVRTVPVPPSILAMLDLTHPTVFTTKTGGPVRVPVFRRRFFKKALISTGLTVRIHDLRHTAISQWIDHGCDLVKVKTWAGHTSSSFTIDRYGHLFRSDHSDLMTALDAMVVF